MKNAPNVDTVQVDLDKEINRLAEMDGLKHPAELDLKIEITRRLYYRATLISYYHGKDEGFAEAVYMTGTRIAKAMRSRLCYGVLIGVVLGSLLTNALLKYYPH